MYLSPPSIIPPRNGTFYLEQELATKPGQSNVHLEKSQSINQRHSDPRCIIQKRKVIASENTMTTVFEGQKGQNHVFLALKDAETTKNHQRRVKLRVCRPNLLSKSIIQQHDHVCMASIAKKAIEKLNQSGHSTDSAGLAHLDYLKNDNQKYITARIVFPLCEISTWNFSKRAFLIQTKDLP